jgi:hypothetical protein
MPSLGSSHCSTPVISMPDREALLEPRLEVACCCLQFSRASQLPSNAAGIRRQLIVAGARVREGVRQAAAAASMPDLMAAWLPLMRAAFMRAGLAAHQRATRETPAWAVRQHGRMAVMARAP